jgi:hypothetical protein
VRKLVAPDCAVLGREFRNTWLTLINVARSREDVQAKISSVERAVRMRERGRARSQDAKRSVSARWGCILGRWAKEASQSVRGEVRSGVQVMPKD